MGVLDRATVDLEAAFTVSEVDRRAPQRWAQLRAEAGLRLPDAIVLDAAVRHHARAVATFDDRLRAAAQARGITNSW